MYKRIRFFRAPLLVILSFLVVFSQIVWFSSTTYGAGSSWNTLNNPINNTSNQFLGMGYGNGVYVAVGSNGLIAASSDAAKWTTRSTNSTQNLNEVDYGNNVYVAAGAGGTILYSTDAVTWNAAASNTSNQLFSVKFLNGSFWAVGASGIILKSSDGQSWTSIASGISNDLYNISYGNSKYVLGDANGKIYYSATGNPSTWSGGQQLNSTYYSSINFIGFLNNHFYAFDSSPILASYRSSDAITWTSTPLAWQAFAGAYGNGVYVLYSNANTAFTSTDGVSWTERTTNYGNTMQAITFGNGKFVAAGNGGSIMYSLDGIEWTTVTPNITDTVYNNGLYVAVGYNNSATIGGTIFTSTDRVNWTSRITPTANGFSSIAYGNGTYVAVGSGGTIYVSSNATNWNLAASNTTSNLQGVQFVNNRFIALGNSGTILTSSDGTAWTPAAITGGPAITTVLYSVAYGNGTYVAVGQGSRMAYSSDGLNWTASSLTGSSFIFRNVVYANNLFVAVGASGKIFTSSDGTSSNWTSQDSTATGLLTGIAYGAGQFMVSGIGGKIVSSPDGASWTSEATNVAAFLTNVVYDGSRFLSLGYNFTTIEAAAVVSSPPLIVGNPSNATINEGGNATFTVAASNTNSYQWQVNTGAGFSNIVNSSTYSGATASTLTITGATVGMNGYQYRVIATGSTAPSAISNSATLTVKAPSIASTIMFKSNAGIAGNATVVSDGQGGSDDIPGFSLDFSAKAAVTLNKDLVLTYEIPYPDTIGASGLSAGYADSESQSIWTIKSHNSSQNFSLESITLIDSGNKDVKIGAFNDGVQVGEWVDLTISVDPWMFTFDQSNGLTISFDNIDEIRIIPQDSEMWISINNVQIGDPVSTPAPSITSNPSNATINEGDNATFTVAASNASSYQWQVNDGAGFTNISNNSVYAGATTATLVIKGATAGMSGYQYRVVASGSTTPAAISNSAALTVIPMNVPLADFANTSKTGTSATFTWSAATGATGLKIEQSPAGANTWTTAATGALATNATTATVTGLSAATGYDFRLVVTGGANAGNSNVVNVTTNSVALIDFASTSKTGTSATFTWSVAAGATGLKIEQSPTGANTWTTATTGALSTNATTATVTGLSAATGYDFRLVVTGGANAGNSNVVTVTTNSVALTDFASASKTGTSATFTWSAATGATNIKVEQSPTGANTWTTATTGVIATNATTATVTGLSAATGYDFRLVVTGGANAGDSNVVTVMTNPIALTDFASASKTGTSATFTWSAAAGATNIKVEQSPTGANTWTTATTGVIATNATTATVTGLSAATGYDFRLVVTGGANAGDSNVVTVMTNPIALTDFASASKTGTSATFTWSAAAGATNIKVEQSPTGTNTWTTATTGALATNATTATVTGLSAATGYDFRLVVTGGANEGNSNVLTVTTYSIEPSQPNPPKTDETDVEVLVNGKIEYAGKATTEIVNNQKVTTIIVDPNKLKNRLESEDQHAVITIPLKGSSDVYASQINGQIISDLEQKQATLVLQHDQFTYTIPASQISIDALTKLFGKKLNLQDLKLEIEIAKPLADTIKMVESAAVKGQFEMVVPPLNFTVRASYDGKTIEVSKFDAYVERMIAIPNGIDSNRITTGIVVEPNGSVRHVPTKLVVKNDKYYAVVNSLTNSTYTIVWHPLAFKDVERHWAKEAVNDMGSRMVITGVGNEMFNPNKSITRAEFAAIIVRGLGLKLETSSSSFSDVNKNEWYSSYIQTAFSNGLINGYEDGTFRPMDKITREQAMAIIAKAMKITGLKPSLAASEAGELLLPYKDANAASEWAKSSILDCLQVEIFSGRSSTVLAPKDEITRAEVAVIIQRLLKKSNLI